MSTKLKCLLLDDELPGLTYLKMLCEQLPELEVVKAFNSVDAFLTELPRLEFDLCIMDIEMPEMNGLQVAALLKGKPVIFTTAYKEYAAEAFDLDALDYVRKPVKKERLQQAVAKAQKLLVSKKTPGNSAQLNTDKGKTILHFSKLCYIKASEIDSRDKMAMLADGTMLLLKNITFKKLDRILPAKDFVRINKKEILRVNAVQTFSFDEITALFPEAPGKILKLNLTEAYRKEFLEKVGL